MLVAGRFAGEAVVVGVEAVLAAFGVAGATLGLGIAFAASDLGVAAVGVTVDGAVVAGCAVAFSVATGSAGTSPLIDAFAHIAGSVSLSI